jgi:hypothetical protein
MSYLWKTKQMIFTDLRIYCDWLMDQGVECDLLQLRNQRGIWFPVIIPKYEFFFGVSWVINGNDFGDGETGNRQGSGRSRDTRTTFHCGSGDNAYYTNPQNGCGDGKQKT